MRRLGQHFLINRAVLRKIAAAVELKPGETVIEIGAGHGELTNELRMMNNELRIMAVEKDKKFIQLLRQKFASDKNIKIIEGDILKILPSIIHNSLFEIRDYKLVGNIPFYLTGRLLRLISELEPKPKLCVFTIQKEVAERLTAAPPNMNRLAAAVQFWARPQIIGVLSKKDFQPAPEVDSAIIKLETRNIKHKAKEDDYYKAVRILFRQPRKTILNNLVGAESKTGRQCLLEELKTIGISPDDRPQNLSVADIVKIAGIMSE